MRLAFGLAAFAVTGCLLLSTHDDRLWACTSDADCSDGQTCRRFVEASACAPSGPGYCVTNDDCRPGLNPQCVKGRCACATNDDCNTVSTGAPATEVCGPDGYCKAR